jgi:hypothetical protein
VVKNNPRQVIAQRQEVDVQHLVVLGGLMFLNTVEHASPHRVFSINLFAPRCSWKFMTVCSHA